MLEIGAGDGSLARALREAGYDVTAIDPMAEPDSGVDPIPLHAIDAPPRHFDAAVAIVSLHHVVPLGESLRKLSEVMRHGARLVIDEMDLDTYDARAAIWWLGHSKIDKQPQDLIAALQEHIQPVWPDPRGAGGVVRRRRAGPRPLPVPLEDRSRAARRGGAVDRRRRHSGRRQALRGRAALALGEPAGALAGGV